MHPLDERSGVDEANVTHDGNVHCRELRLELITIILVDRGSVYIWAGSTADIYGWRLAKETEYFLRTWTSLCLAMDFNQSTAALYVNGNFMEPKVSLFQ